MGPDGIRGKVAAVGVGRFQYKRGQSPYGERALLIRAIVQACEDAGVDPADVDGFVTYGDDRHNEPMRLMPELGTKELRLSTQIFGGGGTGITPAFELAAAMIAVGHASKVIVFRALVEGDTGRMGPAVMAHMVSDHYSGVGFHAPTQFLGLRSRRIIEEHKLPASAVEALIQADYYHGLRNPEAMAYGQTFDVETYRKSRWVVEPLHIYDCSRENDGAAAVLLVGADEAKDLKKKPVYMLAAEYGAYKGRGELYENDPDYGTNGFQAAAARLWKRSGLTIADMDCCQVYENFSFLAVSALIEHGFSSWERAGEDFTLENLTAPNGKLPINTSGGHLAEGFIHGMNCAVEAVRQLRGESSNPVPGARTCLLIGGPGAPSGSAIFANELP
jgi:acetyl-CoA acetyltransferase